MLRRSILAAVAALMLGGMTLAAPAPVMAACEKCKECKCCKCEKCECKECKCCKCCCK